MAAPVRETVVVGTHSRRGGGVLGWCVAGDTVISDAELRAGAGLAGVVFLECRAAVAAAEAVESQDDPRPVVAGVTAERLGSLTLRVGVDLVCESTGEVVFAGQRK